MKFKTDNAYKSIGEVAKILRLVNKKTGKLSEERIKLLEDIPGWNWNKRNIKKKDMSKPEIKPKNETSRNFCRNRFLKFTIVNINERRNMAISNMLNDSNKVVR